MLCNLSEPRAGGPTTLDDRSAPGCRTSLPHLLTWCLGIGLVLSTSWSAASAQAQDEDEPSGIFAVQRIELSVYGGFLGGDTYLELPPLLTPLTNDTALDEILDYDGNSPDPPVQAPTKKIESGWKAGANATFYLSPNFGLVFFGEYGRQEAVFTGQREVEGQVNVLEPRAEIDRATMTSYAAGLQVVYHIGRERKHPIRPYVNLGFGGILNQFANTDDVGALYFTYGGGFAFPVAGNFRGFVGIDSRLFTWETDEVALDSTLQFPGLMAGLTWRYYVPEDAGEEEAGFATE